MQGLAGVDGLGKIEVAVDELLRTAHNLVGTGEFGGVGLSHAEVEVTGEDGDREVGLILDRRVGGEIW